MPEIRIHADKNPIGEQFIPIEPSGRIIDSRFLNQSISQSLPDLYSILNKIPAMNTANDASPQISVRGGNFDQNLVLIDGAVLYYPFHYLAAISSISPEVIEQVKILPGGYSAQYGDRLSAVLSIKTKDPKRSFSFASSVNTTGGDILIGGASGSSLSWLVSGRTSFKNLNRFFQDGYEFGFYDVLGKIKLNPLSNHSIEIMAFQNSDLQHFKDSHSEYLSSSLDSDKLAFSNVFQRRLAFSNRIVSLHWNAVWAKKLCSDFQIYNSSLKNTFDINHYAIYPRTVEEKFKDSQSKNDKILADLNGQERQDTNNNFSDLTCSLNAEYIVNDNLNFSAGLEHSIYDFRYYWAQRNELWEPYVRLFFDHAPFGLFKYDYSAAKDAAFIESSTKVGPKVKLRAGIRTTHWNWDDRHDFEPRLNLNFSFGNKDHVTLTIGKYSQGISTALEEGLVGFLPLFFPSKELAQTATALQYICGLAHLSSRFSWLLSAYYKKYDNLLKSTGLEPQFNQSQGKSFGLEMELSGMLLSNSWKLSYVISRSKRFYNNDAYYAPSDQRHKLQFQIRRDFGKIRFSAFWEFHSGQPYNPGLYHAALKILLPEKDYSDYATGRIRLYEISVPRDRMTYPYYHRLDLSLHTVFRYKKIMFSPYTSVYNVYNRKNPVYFLGPGIDYRYDENDKLTYSLGNRKIVSGIIFTLGIKIEY